MVPSIANNLSRLSYTGLEACTSGCKRVLKIAERGFSLLKEYTPDPRLGLLALGWDIAAGTPLLDESVTGSLFFAHLACKMALELPPFQTLILGVNHQDKDGWTRLHYAASFGDVRMAEYLIQKGADPRLMNQMGDTPLKYAKTAEMVDLLVAAGALVNEQDKDGWTALHMAATKGSLELVRALLKNGADPKITTHSGRKAVELAKNGDVFRVLSGTDGWRELDGCQTKQEIFDKLFPPSHYDLPENAPVLLRSLPFVSELDQLWEEGERLVGTYVPSIEELSEKFAVSQDLEEIRCILYENNPLFRKAWDLANKDRPIILKEGDESAFLRDGKRTHAAGEGAHFCFDDHSITIDRRGSFQTKCDGLIFETINAIQRPTFEWIENKAKLGAISREDYTFLFERIEMNSSKMKEMIESAGLPCERRIDVANVWIEANMIFNGANRSHSDRLREHWDSFYAQQYLEAHQTTLREQLGLMQADKKKPPPYLEHALQVAVVRDDYQLVRKLLDMGANPLKVKMATNDINILKILLGKEKDPAFAKCKNAFDFFDVMFPFDANLHEREELLQKIPVHPNIIRIREMHRKLLSEGRGRVDYEFLKNLAIETNEFLCFIPTEDEQKLTQDSEGACIPFYDAKSHRIKAPMKVDAKIRVQSMFFALILAAQKSSFERLNELGKAGELDREEYTLLLVKILYDAKLCATEILSRDGVCDTFPTFKEAWLQVADEFSGRMTKAYWQTQYAHRYFSRHKNQFSIN